jgi:hypothetical protein
VRRFSVTNSFKVKVTKLKQEEAVSVPMKVHLERKFLILLTQKSNSKLGQGQVSKDGMKVFSEWVTKHVFVIPSDLGYGSRGAGGAIPPNATLIFDVELMDVK